MGEDENPKRVGTQEPVMCVPIRVPHPYPSPIPAGSKGAQEAPPKPTRWITAKFPHDHLLPRGVGFSRKSVMVPEVGGADSVRCCRAVA